jgi:hypothetical protein
MEGNQATAKLLEKLTAKHQLEVQLTGVHHGQSHFRLTFRNQ